MYELIKLYFDICLLKKGPQDLPQYPVVFYITLACYIGVGFLLLFLNANWLATLLQLLASVVIVLILPGLILYVFGKLQRYYQTVSALMGMEAILGFFALPLFSYFEPGRNEVVYGLLLTGLLLWQWVITGHILRQALARPWVYGLGMAFIYMYFFNEVMLLLATQLLN